MNLFRIQLIALTYTFTSAYSWGFLGHQYINQQAVFCLPQEMFGFYKKHISLLTARSVNPDKRRYIVENEGPKHFIDLDYYTDTSFIMSKPTWMQATKSYATDTLQKHGVLPWNLVRLKKDLTEAFIQKDEMKILFLSADIGHYLGDANVPLHTTQNYNGQLSNQYGIHALWESRIPEVLISDFSFWNIKHKYVDNWHDHVWRLVLDSHRLVDSVFTLEKQVSAYHSEDQKYQIVTRGSTNVKTYSESFTRDYHYKMNRMVERQLRKSIQSVADFWYSCWIDAGQPDLNNLKSANFTSDTETEELNKKLEQNHIDGTKQCDGKH